MMKSGAVMVGGVREQSTMEILELGVTTFDAFKQLHILNWINGAISSSKNLTDKLYFLTLCFSGRTGISNAKKVWNSGFNCINCGEKVFGEKNISKCLDCIVTVLSIISSVEILCSPSFNDEWSFTVCCSVYCWLMMVSVSYEMMRCQFQHVTAQLVSVYMMSDVTRLRL